MASRMLARIRKLREWHDKTIIPPNLNEYIMEFIKYNDIDGLRKAVETHHITGDQLKSDNWLFTEACMLEDCSIAQYLHSIANFTPSDLAMSPSRIVVTNIDNGNYGMVEWLYTNGFINIDDANEAIRAMNNNVSKRIYLTQRIFGIND
jgi:hypothetical protein